MATPEAWHEWQAHLVPLADVSPEAPRWVLPGLLPPGVTIVAGEPKTYKSRFVLACAAALVADVPVGDPRQGRVRLKPGGRVVYIAGEQSPRRIRHIYESAVLKRHAGVGRAGGTLDLSFMLAREPMDFQLEGGELLDLLTHWRPDMLALDPLVLFHSYDENDPPMVRPFVALRAAALRQNAAVVVVHHFNKGSKDERHKGGADFSRIRGTSALWAMADAGILMTRVPNGGVNLTCSFKDFPATSWTWKAPV